MNRRNNIENEIKEFNDIIIQAEEHSVPKGKPYNAKPWWSESIEETIHKRKEARKKASNSDEDRTAWNTLCKETKDLIRKAKNDSWKEFTQDLHMGSDLQKVWRTIKSLDGRTQHSKENEAMTHNGKLIWNENQKAEIFCKCYAKESKNFLHSRTAERPLEAQWRQHINSACNHCNDDRSLV